MSHLIGSVLDGRLADLVLWRPENFGSKPEMILKSGVIAYAQVWDATSTSDPILRRFRADGRC